MINENRIRKDSDGCIWVDERWVVDASVFEEEGIIWIDKERLIRKEDEDDGTHIAFVFNDTEVERLKDEIKRLRGKLERMGEDYD